MLLRSFEGKLKSECLSDNNKIIVSASEDRSLGLWRRGNCDLVIKIGLENRPNFMECLPDGKIAVCDTSNDLLLFEIKG